MDLNYLLARHQISLVRADSATSREARYAHRDFVRHYARRITELREISGGSFALPAQAA
jgi:hypothetical protein